MSEIECTKGLTYLGTAYGKEYNQMEVELHYDFLKEYTYQTFVKAVKNLIRSSEFLPRVNKIVEECERCKEQVKHEVIEFMKEKGYFKYANCGEKHELELWQQNRNYDKTINFVERNIVPSWLQEDINYYYKLMKQEKLEYKEQLLIG